MIDIYTGQEKHIHKILGKRAVKELNINTDDIGFICFNCSVPIRGRDLWTIAITVKIAEDLFLQKKYYCQTCIRHGFRVTWKNLLKGRF